MFGFSKIDVMFGRSTAEQVVHRYADLDLPGVEFVHATVTGIDPAARRVTTSGGDLAGDVVVVALGADVHPELTPGLVEDGHEFYSVAGAFAVRDVLDRFDGGRVVVGVTSTPFKCPPAPSETALMLHDLLEHRGLTDRSSISLVMPCGVPIPPSPDASAAIWITVDPRTLKTRFEGVYAVGDVTSVGTPKAGVFAEGQAVVVATEILASVRGTRPTSYDGRGICYMEFGHDEVAKVDVTFQSGQRPAGALEGPGAEQAAEKSEFGAKRVRRWFHRQWSPGDPGHAD